MKQQISKICAGLLLSLIITACTADNTEEETVTPEETAATQEEAEDRLPLNPSSQEPVTEETGEEEPVAEEKPMEEEPVTEEAPMEEETESASKEPVTITPKETKKSSSASSNQPAKTTGKLKKYTFEPEDMGCKIEIDFSNEICQPIKMHLPRCNSLIKKPGCANADITNDGQDISLTAEKDCNVIMYIEPKCEIEFTVPDDCPKMPVKTENCPSLSIYQNGHDVTNKDSKKTSDNESLVPQDGVVSTKTTGKMHAKGQGPLYQVIQTEQESLEDVYKRIIEGTRYCCTYGISNEMERADVTDSAIHKFLLDDLNYQDFQNRCVFLNEYEIHDAYAENPFHKNLFRMLRNTRKACLCNNKDFLKTESEKIEHILYNNRNWDPQNLVYEYIDDHGRILQRPIGEELTRLRNHLSFCQ